MRIIRGKYGRRRFDVPRNITARPTTDFARENIFNVIDNLIDLEGKRALDLFAGTGAVSFEFLSRGCAEVVAVETARIQSDFIKEVANKLGDDNIHVVRQDAFRYPSVCHEPFDIVFADPPYSHKDFDSIADAVLRGNVLKEGAVFILEHSKERDYSNRPEFIERRVYGSVNFSIFRKTGEGSSRQQ